MGGLKRFAVWPFDGERDDASVIEAFDHESAAEEYADDFDSETTEETLCVAEVESEHVETFDLEPDYSRDWIATRRDPPLEAFGWVLSQVPRWTMRRSLGLVAADRLRDPNRLPRVTLPRGRSRAVIEVAS